MKKVNPIEKAQFPHLRLAQWLQFFPSASLAEVHLPRAGVDLGHSVGSKMLICREVRNSIFKRWKGFFGCENVNSVNQMDPFWHIHFLHSWKSWVLHVFACSGFALGGGCFAFPSGVSPLRCTFHHFVFVGVVCDWGPIPYLSLRTYGAVQKIHWEKFGRVQGRACGRC